MIHPRLLVAFLLVSVLFAAYAFTPANKPSPAPVHRASSPSENLSAVDIVDRRKSVSRLVGSGFLGIIFINGSTCGNANAAVAAKTEISATVTSKVGVTASTSTVSAPISNTSITPSRTLASSTPTPAYTSTSKLENPGDAKNCPDFATYKEAKEWFDKYYDLYGDVAKLDKNKNGIPCESLPGAPVSKEKN